MILHSLGMHHPSFDSDYDILMLVYQILNDGNMKTCLNIIFLLSTLPSICSLVKCERLFVSPICLLLINLLPEWAEAKTVTCMVIFIHYIRLESSCIISFLESTLENQEIKGDRLNRKSV